MDGLKPGKDGLDGGIKSSNLTYVGRTSVCVLGSLLIWLGQLSTLWLGAPYFSTECTGDLGTYVHGITNLGTSA